MRSSEAIVRVESITTSECPDNFEFDYRFYEVNLTNPSDSKNELIKLHADGGGKFYYINLWNIFLEIF